MTNVSDLGSFLSGTTQAPGVDMTGGGANNGLLTLFNSPQFQLQYGTNPLAQLAGTGSYDPNLAFQTDPGVQGAVRAGMVPLQNSMDAKGLGTSGALSQALTQYMYNNYNQYTQGQESLFGNYQNQLMNLANLGSANSGANAAAAAGQNQAGIIANSNLATGQNISNANLATGSNISSIYGNAGNSIAGAQLNTGAAQANNLFQGMQLYAQLKAGQNANVNGQQASLFNGMGQASGYQSPQNAGPYSASNQNPNTPVMNSMGFY